MKIGTFFFFFFLVSLSISTYAAMNLLQRKKIYCFFVKGKKKKNVKVKAVTEKHDQLVTQNKRRNEAFIYLFLACYSSESVLPFFYLFPPHSPVTYITRNLPTRAAMNHNNNNTLHTFIVTLCVKNESVLKERTRKVTLRSVFFLI